MTADKILLRNLSNGKWAFGSFAALTLFANYCNVKRLVKVDIFGYDGNGGDMIKIITNLTDEEMARMKHVRRMHWHWRGGRRSEDGNYEPILDQELADRDIAWPQEPYIEYVKRPPHDKYL